MKLLENIFLDPIKMIYRNRTMILQTSFNDIRSRYAGSLLGLAWTVIYPLLFLGCYASVYIFIFQVTYEGLNMYEYVVLIFCGLVPFIGFQDALASGTSCIVANASLMKNTMFPIELVPIKTILGVQTTQIAGTIMMVIALIAVGRASIYTPLVLVMWCLQLMFDIGLVWIVSSINVIARDLQNIIGIVILLLMMMSPIAFSVDRIPDMLKPFLKINPMYYIISAYQDVLIFQRAPRMATFIPFLVMTIIIFFGGYQFFIKMKKVFIDNV